MATGKKGEEKLAKHKNDESKIGHGKLVQQKKLLRRMRGWRLSK